MGDRLNQRQMSTFLIGGPPTPMLGRLPLGTEAKPSFSTALSHYFSSVNRKLKKHDEGLATAATTIAGATPASSARFALDATTPHGWFRWYWYYDSAGRPSQMYYPRRDEADRTSVVNTYDRGWLSSATVTLVDPFNPSAAKWATAALAYSPSGNQSHVIVTAQSPGTQVYSLRTPDDGSMGRIGQWLLDRGVPSGGYPYGTPFEYRGYTYDGSGNLNYVGSGTFVYDARSRLTKFIENSLQIRKFDSFGNLWRIDDSISGTQVFTPEMSTNRHIATGSGIPAAYDGTRGTLIFDATQARNVGRDYYADGRPMSEYGRTSGSYATVYPVGISVYLEDARGERAMTFHGDGINCDNELFRQTIRDESGRPLTDYKADNQGACNCSTNPCQWTDRFERDYVWVGSYTQMSLKRGDVPHFTSLDHLGSPRHQLNSTGGAIGINVLDAWGTQVSVNQPERTRFTGHERNNVDLDGPYLPISDYMHTRTYVPMLGRFTSPDIKRSFSLFSPAEMNRYSYAAANPAKYIDPNGKEIFVAAHAVGLGRYHSSVLLVPRDQQFFAGKGPFTQNYGGGLKYATLGAGPESARLRSDQNRRKDVDLSIKAEYQRVDIGSRDEKTVIMELLAADAKYRDSLPYTLFPSEGDDSYNSNSYVAGLLGAVGLTPPTILHKVPGYSKPVPPEYFGIFDSQDLTTEEGRLRALGLRKTDHGIEPIN